MTHSWKLEGKEWMIKCSETDKNFSPNHDFYFSSGKCPFCEGEARKELDLRKQEKYVQRLQDAKKEKIKKKNTLDGY
jgi:radical SAM superfamily enzyme